MTTADIRIKSLEEAKRLKYPTNVNLPLLDKPTSIRSTDEAGGRLLALYAAVSVAYGFESAKARNWLAREGLGNQLTEPEAAILASTATASQRNAARWQVEALWVLAWALRCHDVLDFSDSCSDDFIRMLPDIKADASSQPFLGNLKMRGEAELLQACDLAYCLHWGAREMELVGKSIPYAVRMAVIAERRRALDWLLTDQSWDDVSFDT